MSHQTYLSSIIEKNRMLADFYIPRLSNDMKIAVQQNYLVAQIFYRSLVPSKTNRVTLVFGQLFRYFLTNYFLTKT